jgi:SAM-dependent methyltransferase
LAEAYLAEETRIRAAYAARAGGERYSWLNPAYTLEMHGLERRLLGIVRHLPLDLATARILDIGCGKGYWLRRLVEWGGRPENLAGIDLLPDRIAQARRLSPAQLHLECASASDLPFDNCSFELVLQFTVFTSILDERLKHAIAAEMLRVTRPGGTIVWYDFAVGNPRNPDVRGVSKREIARLFPGCRLKLKRVTLAPPLARSFVRISPLACQVLEFVPLLASHYLGTIEKPCA